MSTFDDRAWLALCEQWLEGDCSPEDAEILAQSLEREPARAASFARLAEEWALLAEVAHAQAEAAPLAGPGSGSWRPLLSSLSALAAALVLALFFLRARPTQFDAGALNTSMSEPLATQRSDIFLRPPQEAGSLAIAHDLSSQRQVRLRVERRSAMPGNE